MRARIVHLATPRRVVATECLAGALGALVALLMLGPTPVSLGLLVLCVTTMVPMLVAVDRLEKRRSR